MSADPDRRIDDVDRALRDAAPAALAVLVRRTGDFEGSEDALQEARLAASTRWLVDPPESPTAWLIAVAYRRYVEALRGDVARRRREREYVEQADAVASSPGAASDDTLALFLLCCHPALSRPAQVALTLRALGGLTTAEIARALLVPEKTVGQWISRAKAAIRAAGSTFRMPAPTELAARAAAVCDVLYLIFTEGHTASAGERLARVDLTTEAVRLARQLHAITPADAPWRGESAGLLALMLLTEARRPARIRGADGALVPLAEQDRALWDRALVEEGVDLVTSALATAPAGPFQLQAAIAAVHDEASGPADTDWEEILGLYELLRRLAPGPMVELNRVVAVAMVRGADAALRELATVALEPALAGHFRVHAVRGHVLELAGRTDAARVEFARAADLALNLAERTYLLGKAAAR